ncbi:MAG TPA: glycosyltransferase family 61 protein, partial [Chthoniobacterales bacterium]
PRAIHLFRVRESTVYGQGSVVLAGGHLVADSAAEFINHDLAPDGSSKIGAELWIDQPSGVMSLDGKSLLVKRPWYRNYGHWLVDLLPILPLVARCGVDVQHVVFGDLGEGQFRAFMAKAAAAYFPQADIRFIRDDEHLMAESLLYVQPVHVPPMFKHPGAIQAGVEAAFDIYKVNRTRNRPHRRLYVSRKHAIRTVVNEEEVEAYLGSAGFETVLPERHDIASQIQMFNDAEIVLGVKGAGMTNIVYSQPSAKAVIFSPGTFIDPFFWDLLSPRGIEYHEVFSPVTDGATAGESAASISVDLTLLRGILRPWL